MLTSESISLIHMINQIPFVPSFVESYREKFTTRTELFIKSLLRKIDIARRSWFHQKKTIFASIIQKPISMDTDVLMYIPNPICNSIHSDTFQQFSCTMNMQFRTIHVNLTIDRRIKSKAIERIFMKIYMWFCFVDEFTDSDCSSHVNLFLYFTTHIKRKPSMQTKIDRVHVNTAFTTGCNRTTDICIYRSEEWFKVLIHESFHNLGLDFIGLDSDIQTEGNTFLNQLFHTNIPDIRFYETYSEMCGEILNSVFYCFFTSGNKKMDDLDTIVHNIHICFTYESLFSMIQCSKILQHHGLSYRDIFENPINMKRYQEETQVFSYYILKCIFMNHFTDFLDLVSSWNTFKFPLTKKTFILYLNIIKTKMKSDKMIIGMKESEMWLQNNHTSFFENEFTFHTLRMSLIEFV